MATKMKRLSLHLRTFLLMISMCLPSDGYNCPYGQNCRFEPAVGGQTPPCAKPGLTFCTNVDPYPEQLIRRLIEAGQYDIRTLLMDESREDFNSKKGHYPYGPNSIPNVDQISLVNDDNYNKFNPKYNHDIFSQKTPLQPPSPVDPSPYNVNTYQSTNFTKFGYNGYHTPGYWNNPTKALRPDLVNPNYPPNPNNYNAPNLVTTFDSNVWFRQSNTGVTEYNPNEWWKYVSPSRSDSVTVQRSVSYSPHNMRRKRNAELVKASMKRKLTGAEALRIALGLASEDASAERPRRQAADTEELCASSSQFITPRAALNNKGKWTYVVNMPDTMTQLVRVEICRSMNSECNGLCSVPFGYRSRCDQKYIQKRLVALKPEGDNLYTDVFWIPSCCQCSIVNNNNN